MRLFLGPKRACFAGPGVHAFFSGEIGSAMLKKPHEKIKMRG